MLASKGRTVGAGARGRCAFVSRVLVNAGFRIPEALRFESAPAGHLGKPLAQRSVRNQHARLEGTSPVLFRSTGITSEEIARQSILISERKVEWRALGALEGREKANFLFLLRRRRSETERGGSIRRREAAGERTAR